MTRRTLAILCALGYLAMVSPAARAEGESVHERGPWYIGFSLGSGNGAITTRDNTYTSFDDIFQGYTSSRVSMNFHAGVTVSARLLFGGEFFLMRETGKEGDLERTLQIALTNAVVTFFPRETGVFIRAGAGMADYSLADRAPKMARHVSGMDILGGAGYAFWFLKSFNLVLGGDYSRQWYRKSGTMPEESHLYNLSLGCDWY